MRLMDTISRLLLVGLLLLVALLRLQVPRPLLMRWAMLRLMRCCVSGY